MEKLDENLYKYNLFKKLPKELLQNYLNEGVLIKKTYQQNEILHFEGEKCTQIELILEGEIAVERIDESGNLLTVAVFGPNDLIGTNLVFSSTHFYPMTITARKDTYAIVISKNILLQLCNKYPEFLLQFVQIISDHTLIIGTKVKNHINRTIKDKIITYIREQYLLQKSTKIKLSMTKKSLAELMGISRTSLSRELQKMKQQHLIDYDMKSITIIDINLIK
ncbi:MAG: Crp/Fnr family transcriptional regulator [Eubacteriales bacterium]